MGSPSMQTSFVAGEVTPKLRGRVDSPLYRNGLALCQNWEVLPHGPIRMAPGSRHVAELLGGSSARLIPFRLSSGEDVIVELADLSASIYTEAGRVVFGVSNLITDGSFSNLGASWTETGDVEYIGGGARMYARSQYNAVLDEIEWTYGRVLQTVDIAGDGDYQFSFVFTSKRGAAVALDVTVGATTVRYTSTGTKSITVPLSTGLNDVIFEVASETAGDYVTIDDVSLIVTSGATTIATPWTAAQLRDVQFVAETGKDRLIFVHPAHAPRTLTRNTDGSWSFATPALTAAPASWAGSNWPSVVEIHQGRLWLAAPPDEKHTFWASKSGDLFNFTAGSNDGDSFSLKVATKGQIRWMQGERALLIGTDLGDYVVTSSGGFVTPTDFEVRQESGYGSAAHQALFIGDQVLYLSRNRRKVRAIGFTQDVEGWISRDVTWAGDHLVEGGVLEVHFARDPHPLIILVLLSGELAVFTVDRVEGVVAGWRRVLASGSVRSAAVSEGSAGSQLWLAVQRTSGTYLERIALGDASCPLDAAVVTPVPANLTVTGLDALEGETVRIVLDGAVELDQVVAGGSVLLERTGSEVAIGLGYTATARTLRKETGPGRVRDVKAGVILEESALPKLNGYRATDRSPETAMDTVEAPRTGRAEVSVEEGTEGEITIEQDLPVATQVLAIYSVAAASRV